MTATVIRSFGGLMPSVKPRALPNNAAQIAQNLDMRFNDFHPCKGLGTSVTAVAAAAKSIFRTPTGVWLNSSADVDYVLGQIQDSAVERVYLTGRSGYPEAWQSGAYRPLGVPAPTTAVSVTVAVVDEFTTQEMIAGRAKIPDQIATMFKAALVPANIGTAPSNPPTTTAPGWLAHGSQGDLPTKSNLQWAFCAPMVLTSGNYVMKYPESHNFLLINELGGVRISYGGNPYWAVPLYIQGQGATINSTALTASLKTVMNPSNTAVRLWTDPEVDAIVARVVAGYSTSIEPIKALIDGINAALVTAQKVYDAAGLTTDTKAAMTAFFTRTEVIAQLSTLRGTPGLDSPAAKDGAYTQEVAGRCYALGHFDSTMAESNVSSTDYFSATYTTSVAAAIRADYDASLMVDQRGVKTYDRTALGKILRDEMNSINNQRTDNRWSPTHIEADAEYCLSILDRTYSDTNWAENTAWPYKAAIDTHYNASASVAMREGLKAACDAVSDQYEQMRKNVLSYIENDLFDLEILTKLSDPVDRIGESRCYIYTYVTDWGEESAPSPPSVLVDCDQNDTVTVVAPVPPAGKNIRRIRLYRSSSSNSGSAFQFVVQNSTDVSDAAWAADAVQRTLEDHFRQEELQEVCPSLTWDTPPTNMIGLMGMPNGIMLGFDGVRVCPCEPYQPYAFPVDYQQTMEYQFVGAGVFGQTAVILTTGNPYYCSGADSASLSLQKIESNQACISKRSVHGGDGGVFYASPDGICLAGPSGVALLTEGVYSRADWQALNPANSFGRYHDGIYYLFLISSNTVLALDLKSKRISTMTLTVTGAYADLASDTLYVANGTALQPMFGGAAMTGKWRSPILVAAGFWGNSCWQVESDFEADVTLRLYGDGVLVHTATFNNREPQRLPATRNRDIEVEIESTARATVVALATSMHELGTA